EDRIGARRALHRRPAGRPLRGPLGRLRLLGCRGPGRDGPASGDPPPDARRLHREPEEPAHPRRLRRMVRLPEGRPLMTEFSKIEWCDHTFNPWWGCVRVSPACRFCYADTQARRYGHQVWRKRGPRRLLSDANWAKPLKWNRDAEKSGVPAKVFCASIADVFEDHPDVAEPRKRLWNLIEATPWLRWLLLTKRPENIAAMAPWGAEWPPHVWVGTSVENQRFAEERIPILLRVPAAVLFLSCEPLL